MRLHLKNMNEHDTFKQKVTNVRFTVTLWASGPKLQTREGCFSDFKWK